MRMIEGMGVYWVLLCNFWIPFLLPPAKKLRQGNVFTGVCDSVHRGEACVAKGGVCMTGETASAAAGTHPTGMHSCPKKKCSHEAPWFCQGDSFTIDICWFALSAPDYLIIFHYCPQRKLGVGNVFGPVCDSVCRGQVCTPPWADTPQTDSPLSSPPPDGHWSGRYASYWNAFLFCGYVYTNAFRRTQAYCNMTVNICSHGTNATAIYLSKQMCWSWRPVHTVRFALCATAFFYMLFCEIIHTVWWLRIQFALYFIWNRTLQSHRMGVEPIYVWHRTHHCIARTGNRTMWRSSLTSTQSISCIANIKKKNAPCERPLIH